MEHFLGLNFMTHEESIYNPLKNFKFYGQRSISTVALGEISILDGSVDEEISKKKVLRNLNPSMSLFKIGNKQKD